jgi:hypothetical protein
MEKGADYYFTSKSSWPNFRSLSRSDRSFRRLSSCRSGAFEGRKGPHDQRQGAEIGLPRVFTASLSALVILLCAAIMARGGVGIEITSVFIRALSRVFIDLIKSTFEKGGWPELGPAMTIGVAHRADWRSVIRPAGSAACGGYGFLPSLFEPRRTGRLTRPTNATSCAS